MHVCMMGDTRAMAHMWKSEDSFVGLVLSFCLSMGSEHRTQGTWIVQGAPVQPPHWPLSHTFKRQNNIPFYECNM